jgi:hypothetical protein
MFYDECDFMARNLSIISSIRELQEYFFSDSEALSLLSCKVFFDELAAGASKVADDIGEVLANVDLTVRVSDLVDNLHYFSSQD